VSSVECMALLDSFVAVARQVNYLAVVSTLRADQTIQSTLVNAGVLPSPFDGEPVLAFVTYGKVKLANLRARPQVAVTSVSGWQWSTVEGQAAIVGPDDLHPDVDAERLRVLLREVFQAAGGTHDDWNEYDRAMRDERRAAVLVTPTRTYPG
jgi:PPOX class probable F420-dependent enzyme